MSVGKIDGVDGVINYPVKDVTLYATAAVTAGNVVQIDTGAAAALLSAYGRLFLVKPASAADDTGLAFGVALQTCLAPASGAVTPILVRVGGKIGTGDVGAPTDGGSGITAGALVGADSSPAGTIKSLGTISATVVPFATCIKTYSTSGTDGEIVIHNKGWYGS
jgi:hypothetical protein